MNEFKDMIDGFICGLIVLSLFIFTPPLAILLVILGVSGLYINSQPRV